MYTCAKKRKELTNSVRNSGLLSWNRLRKRSRMKIGWKIHLKKTRIKIHHQQKCQKKEKKRVENIKITFGN